MTFYSSRIIKRCVSGPATYSQPSAGLYSRNDVMERMVTVPCTKSDRQDTRGGRSRAAQYFIVALATFSTMLGSCGKLRAESPLYQMQEEAASTLYWKSVRLMRDVPNEVIRLEGAGVINRIWCTFIPKDQKQNDYLGRALVLNIYWDGSEKPAVSAPLADFFCQPLHLQPIQNHFFSSSNRLCVFNSLIPMPFRNGARIEVLNDSGEDMLFWYGLDVEKKAPNDNALYLHSYWKRHVRVEPEDEMVVLPTVIGKGRYLGTQFALEQVDAGDKWRWYTRNLRIFQDNEDEPSTLIGTLDDYVCSGWWSLETDHQPDASPFTGRSLVSKRENGSLAVAFYRYHVPDPIWFHKSLSVRVGKHVQYGKNPLPKIAPGDWSTTAYFYLHTPSNSLPAIQDTAVRTDGF